MGNHTVWMYADSLCSITESSENNNKRRKTITVGAADTTPPTSTINSPEAGSWQDNAFTVSVSDSDTGGSDLSTCYY